MQSKRLDAIISFLSADDKLIDVGTDHAYIPIIMAKKNAKTILATDIHKDALEIAKTNIKRYDLENVIKTKLTDGLKNVNTTLYDTLVIAGMGTSTIINILSNADNLKPFKKIILQSNNELEKLRIFMNENSYTLKKEKVVLEKNKYYVIMNYEKGKQKLTKEELFLGLYNSQNKEYYQFLSNKYLKIKNDIYNKDKIKNSFITERLEYISNYLQKENRII